ncbi:MAG: AAA family ATPase [Ignavibacteriae bacterium]|nr:AAA family ATPase [Ignavibacteriota bacterium]
MDLDPDNNKIVLGFEYVLTYTEYKNLRNDYDAFDKKEKKKVAEKKIKEARELKEFLKQGLDKYFTTQKLSFEYDLTTQKVNESNYINLDSEKISIKNIISFKYIPARRDVTNKDKDNTLSKQTSSLYKKNEDSEEKTLATEDFKDQLADTDIELSKIYKGLFDEVVKNVNTFGGIKLNETSIDIISTLQHRNLLEGNTTVVYTHDIDKLPEQYNGLGYMNLISMIFEEEILRQEFKRKKDETPSDINLLIIEEPEAHTHPQMQYVFIKNIKSLLNQGIIRQDGDNRKLQTVITTHSSHIVSESNFDDIKYLKKEGENSVIAKNLVDLRKQYDADETQYQFLKQYLTISRAEIFFADKAILIEGDTERILIPTLMKKIDKEEERKFAALGVADPKLPLSSQNVSIIEVGAYSHIFEKFIEFIGIKSLIITDLDAVGEDSKKCRVADGASYSNDALKLFFNNATLDELKGLTIDKKKIIKNAELWQSDVNGILCVVYQTEENGVTARSFEDAFIQINRDFIDGRKDDFKGLKNRDFFNDSANDSYKLAEECVRKKTHFALDILFHTDKEFTNWEIPLYIKEGLLWLK